MNKDLEEFVERLKAGKCKKIPEELQTLVEEAVKASEEDDTDPEAWGRHLAKDLIKEP